MTDPMLTGYLAAALWTARDEDGEPLGDDLADLAEESREQAAREVTDFADDNADALAVYLSEFTSEQAGHDLWLTRNGHGAGFWDRDYSGGDLYRACQALADAARVLGESDLYRGDDGALYLYPHEPAPSKEA